MKKVKNQYLLFLLIAVILLSQYDLLRLVIQLGFTPDDWSFILKYKLLGPQPFSKVVDVWNQVGSYGTFAIYFMGALYEFNGLNFEAIQLTNITFKIINTIAVYPLILIAFKNRLLAFLTTIFFAISFTTTSALETAVEPSEYLGMFFLLLFLMTYIFIIRKKVTSLKWFLLALLTLILAFCMSVPRIYPIFFLMPLIEVFLLFNSSVRDIRMSVKRLVFLYLPFLILYLYNSSLLFAGRNGFPEALSKSFSGNWHLLLVPFQGIGHMFPFNEYLTQMGVVKVNNIYNYVSYLFNGPFIVFGVFSLFFTFITPVNKKRFLFISLVLNLFAEVITYYIATSNLYLPVDRRLNFDSPRLYSTLLGEFILVSSIAFYFEWKKKKENNILLALWVGPVFSMHFILLTWILADLSLGFGGPQNHYLLIPQLGGSLFVGALLTAIYDRTRGVGLRENFLKALAIAVIALVFFIFYYLNRLLIYDYFNNALKNDGRSAKEQLTIQNKFRDQTKNIDFTDPVFFYFDTQDITGDGRFYTEGFLSSFPFWMHFKEGKIIDGCTEMIYGDINALKALVKIVDGEEIVTYRSFCINKGNGGSVNIMVYKMENVYAFRLKNRNLINITDEVRKELGFVNEY